MVKLFSSTKILLSLVFTVAIASHGVLLGADLVPAVPAPMPAQIAGPLQTAPSRDSEIKPASRTITAVPRAVNAFGAAWVQQGPTASMSNCGNVNSIPALPPNPANPQVGAVNRLAANGTTILAATPNGGIWRTTNGAAVWTPVTDNFPLSVSSVSFDFNDPNIALAGFGRSSSLSSRGSSTLMGVLRSTDNGQTWALLPGSGALPQLSVSGVQGHSATQVILVTCKNTTFSNDGGIFRSTDNGATFTDLSNKAPLTTGSYVDMVADPANAGTYYVAHRGSGQEVGQNPGVFRSTDDGATWTDISAGMPEIGTTTSNLRLAVGTGGVVFAGIVNNNELAAVYRSANARTTATWVAQGLPTTTELGTVYGIHPGKQGGSQFGITVDPADNTIVYVAGDRQPANNENGKPGAQFPNSIGATSYSGRIFRLKGGVWQSITSTGNTAAGEGTASNSAPHADSRDIVFEGATGNLLCACDGGIYRRNLPQSNTGDWTSGDGNLAITEYHSIAYDGNYNIVFGGAQDNGVSEQPAANAQTWPEIGGGDGGNVAVDDSVAGTSVRFVCSQNWGGLQRRTVVGGAVTDVTTLGLKVGTQTIFDFDNNAVQFYGPFAINAITPTRMIFGTNRVFESADRGDTLTDLSGLTGAPVTGIVYGGKTGGVANADLLYAGSGNTIRVRTTAGGTLNVLTTYTGGTIKAIAADPNNYNVAVVADKANKIWLTLDGGATAFQDVTGDLPLTNLSSVAFIPAAGNIRVMLAGGQGGVYATGNGDTSVWTKVGANLPAQVQVDDIEYSAKADVLCIGTLGRGAYTIPAASTIFGGPIFSFTSITPNTGPTAGGTTVTIKGTGFSGVPTVTFDGVPATGVAAVTPTSFTCVVPASVAGKMGGVDVKVNSTGQTQTRINSYVYINAPTITGLTPAEGVVTGGTTVTITGLNFAAGAAVAFGANAATGVVVNAANQITCVSPAGAAPGAVQVTVTAQGATSPPANFNYLAAPPAAPTIVNITPPSGPALGGTMVTITGTGFDTTPGAMSVSFDGTVVPAANITVVSPTTMTLTTPPGKVNPAVAVIASTGGTPSAPFTGFAYTGMDAPMVAVMATTPNAQDPQAPLNPDENGYGVITITLITPVAVGEVVTIGFELSGNAQPGSDYQALGGNTVTITGPDQSADVLIIPMHRTTIVGPETVTLTITTGPAYLVGPQNSATVTILDDNEQTVGKVVPSSGSTAGGDVVQIQGDHFAAGMKVYFNGVLATNVEILSTSLIQATTPPGVAGPADVTVDDDGIAATLTAGYTYVTGSTLTNVSPKVGTTLGGTVVTLTGSNFAAGAKVAFNNVPATNVKVVNATTITCTTPAGTAGPAAITITVGGASKTFPAAYTYIAPPSVTALSPASGIPSGGTNVTIVGANFATGATVTFGAAAAANVVVVNANTITCTTPPGTGVVDVTVTVSGVSGKLAGGFTYVIPPPSVTAINPNIGLPAGGTNVTIFGANFAPDAMVLFGANPAANVVVPSSTTITCATPAGTGTVDVTVITNGLTAKLANGFTYFDSDATALILGKISGKFGKNAGTDTLQVSASLPLPASFSVSGASVEVVIGTYDQVFKLGSNGTNSDKNSPLKLSTKPVNGYTAFKLSIKKQDLFSKLAPLGFVKTTDAIVNFPVTIIIGGVRYRGPKLVSFKAKSESYSAK